MAAGRLAMMGFLGLILLASCGFAYESYYSLESRGGTSEDADPWFFHGPIISAFSTSKEMHIQARVAEYSGCDVFNVIGGPLIALSCLGYEPLPDSSLTVFMLINRPCHDVVKIPVDYDWTDEVEECASTRIRVKPKEMALLFGDGTRFAPSYFRTISEEKDGIVAYGQATVQFEYMSVWELGGKDIEGLFLILQYEFPPAADTSKLEFLSGGLYLDDEKQAFPPFVIRKSSGWKYTQPG